jgi:hypothetical protein
VAAEPAGGAVAGVAAADPEAWAAALAEIADADEDAD